MNTALLVVLCIVGYIIIGLCIAMFLMYLDVKDHGHIDDDDETEYIAVGILWPLSIALFIIIYPFYKMKQFLEWFAKKLEEGNRDD